MRTSLAFALLGTSAGAAAQINLTPPSASSAPGSLDERMQKLLAADANHDGKWSRDEWLAAGRRAQGFDYLDTNKDGFVDKAELQAGMARRRNNRFVNSQPMTPEPAK